MKRRNPTAYHGSQARFTAFTVDGVGKTHGMGYGWGVYLTSDQPTAAVYAGAGGAVYTIKIPKGPWMPWSGRTESPSLRRIYKKVFASLRHVTEKCSTLGTSPFGEETYQYLVKEKKCRVAGGHVYDVVARLLNDSVGDKTSRLLRSHGILGAVYKQPQSRLKDGSVTPEGATNYVVFDPKDIRMTTRSNPGPAGQRGRMSRNQPVTLPLEDLSNLPALYHGSNDFRRILSEGYHPGAASNMRGECHIWSGGSRRSFCDGGQVSWKPYVWSWWKGLPLPVRKRFQAETGLKIASAEDLGDAVQLMFTSSNRSEAETYAKSVQTDLDDDRYVIEQHPALALAASKLEGVLGYFEPDVASKREVVLVLLNRPIDLRPALLEEPKAVRGAIQSWRRRNPRVSLRAMPRLSPAARRQLARGTRVEMEHTGDRKAARLIAAQHLAESPRYYGALAKMEKGLRPNPPIPYETPNLAGMRVLTGFRPARQLHHHTCGPACLRAVLAWNSIEVTEAALAKQANTTKKHGTKPEDMVLTLQDYGRRARLCLNADVNWCLRQLRRDCPVIILWNDWHGHWVVLIGYDPKTKRLLFADPANPKNGLRVHSLDTLRRNWTVKVAGTKYKRLAISVA